MERLNRDSVIAIALLLFCGVFFWASFDIRSPDYGVLKPSTWPRTIIAVLTFLSLIYLVQSLRGNPEIATASKSDREPGIRGWIDHWRNPLWCFGLFFVYLSLLPVLGMLIDGILFVWLLMGVLGGFDGKKPLFHLFFAMLAIVPMWSLFTFALGVILPPGMILGNF
ncbi:MAG: tripartite tricarboxylate transporter TctB family protein [Rhodospirillaceae bacterium]|jgi:putative tricarboxylic transport membrane protein|nr:tripartite tricarboxylate transporter TctB family protein [Rhodospirillaceae bacterium]MBT7137810.1 tripartite tricarboxylate transporter TctB family protein [Rhodospirillaceae bacterium]